MAFIEDFTTNDVLTIDNVSGAALTITDPGLGPDTGNASRTFIVIVRVHS